ncbi:DNA-binding response regulator, NarL/FixJ family, contains REC and HTH domains [Cnuella takakiae]|uniref:DNA-binding response regulator, NarL/FixJ family, contains REC and HTH domains n=1 Tax=Cnuella takakiae TaxID=1302690 RepID=A0A1M5A1U9_9BACT|nr:LuxR C-terminal-related transcriptional regulator [Cnuella takakiae]SHF24201.1 DNA-binding response regulator, NarL/FixJ family, contains REC and HTH domains [Cnuella takakiae]
MTHVAIIEPGYYTRTAYVEYLNSFRDFHISFAAPAVDDATVDAAFSAGLPVDILIYGLSDADDWAFVVHHRRMSQKFPGARFVVVSNCNAPDQLAGMLRLGVHGHVMRSHRMNNLMVALEEVRQGAAALCGQSVLLLRRYFCEAQQPLPGQFTAREAELISLVCSGASIQHIAETLVVSTTTVNYHLQKLYKKFKVCSRAELMAAVGRQGSNAVAMAC